MPIPLFLITGFLGSGKTTFLKNVSNKYSQEKKIAIVQNEFAPALKEKNPFAEIYTANYCNVELNNLFNHEEETVAQKRIPEHKDINFSGRPETGIAVLRSGRNIKPEYIIPFLEETTKNTIRVKGYIKSSAEETLAIQSSFNILETEVVKNYTGNTELIYIGENVTISSTNKSFKNFLNLG